MKEILSLPYFEIDFEQTERQRETGRRFHRTLEIWMFPITKRKKQNKKQKIKLGQNKQRKKKHKSRKIKRKLPSFERMNWESWIFCFNNISISQDIRETTWNKLTLPLPKRAHLCPQSINSAALLKKDQKVPEDSSTELKILYSLFTFFKYYYYLAFSSL